MTLNFKKIIIEGYNEQCSMLVDYFKQQAQLAKRDNFVEFAVFFNRCKDVVIGWRDDIKRQYQRTIEERQYIVGFYKNELERGKTIDRGGEPIQDIINRYESGIKNIMEAGYANNNRYFRCEVDMQDSDSRPVRYVLYYSDLEAIFTTLLQVKQELIPSRHQTITIPDKTDYQIPSEILQALEQNGIITQNPLEWLKSKSLLAYFVVGMCETYKLKHGQKRQLKPFETLFNVKNLSNTINDIKKVGTKPPDCETINQILSLSKKFFNDNFLNDK
ncbi:MAG: hypothetical protein LBS69_03900 [Prevotellaceae bacterium]|jgi:hypothetical protein|nr:hypothetical protein [Prevotellaceae bacterium]